MQKLSNLATAKLVPVNDGLAELYALDNKCFEMVCELHTIATEMANVELVMGIGPDTESLIVDTMKELGEKLMAVVRKLLEGIAGMFSKFSNITRSIEKDFTKEFNRVSALTGGSWVDDKFELNMPPQEVKVIIAQQYKLFKFYTSVFTAINSNSFNIESPDVAEMLSDEMRKQYSSTFNSNTMFKTSEMNVVETVNDAGILKAATHGIITGNTKAHKDAGKLIKKSSFESKTDDIILALSTIQQYVSTTNGALIRYLVGYTALLQNIK